MKIIEIQIGQALLNAVKPALCTDTETFFSIKALRKSLQNIINDYNECLQSIMTDYDIKPEQTPKGTTYNYAEHPKKPLIDKHVAEIGEKLHTIDPVKISKGDYKILVNDLQLDEIEYLDNFFAII